MKRRTVELKRISSGSPVQLTLNVLQQRLNDAENQAKSLVSHLEKFGFKNNQDAEIKGKELKEDGKISSKSSRETGKDRLNEDEKLHKNYEEMASRVCKMESMIQSLKTGMHGLAAERTLTLCKNEEEIENLKANHEKEIIKLEEKLSKLNKESNEMREENQRFQTEVGKLIEEMRDFEVLMEKEKANNSQLETRIEKIILQKEEVTEQLEREVSMRQSLEEAHEALLQRVHDMESVVDAERNQVNELVTNWDNTRQQEAATKEAFENEHELRMHLEALVTHQEQGFDSCKEKLKIVAEENKRMSIDLSKFKKENNSLKTQLETNKKTNSKVKQAYESLMKDSQKLHDALKIAATDNKALIAQHKDAIQREKDRVNAQIAAQDQMLDNAKNAILKELERQKAIVRNTEQENQDVKAKLKLIERKLEEKNEEITTCKRKHELEITQRNCIIESLREDKDVTIEDKNKKIQTMENNIIELRNEISSKDLVINQLKNDLQRCKGNVTTIENENMKLATRLSTAEHSQLSQKQIEGAMNEMMTAKNKLAYEKGVLQSKVDQLNVEISGLSAVKVDHDGLKQKMQDLQENYNKLLSDLKTIQIQLNEKENELLHFKDLLEKRDANIKNLVDSREEALLEVQKLLLHAQSIDEKYKKEVASLQSSLEISQAEKKNLSQSFQSVMQSHSKLQSSNEQLQTKLGRKDSEILNLIEERLSTQNIVTELQDEMTSLQNKILALQNHDSNELEDIRNALLKLEKEKKILKTSIETLKADKKKLKEELINQGKQLKMKIEELSCEIEERKNKEEQCHDEHQKENQNVENKLNEEIKQNKKLKHRLDMLENNLNTAEHTQLSTQAKFKKLKEKVRNQKRDIANYQYENQQQANTIAEFSAQIRNLEAELKAKDDFQFHPDMSMRHYEDEVEEEKHRRLDAESRCMTLETKLKDASRANIQISNDLKEAQLWFQRKVGKLEKELESAKQTQYILEQTASEQEKLTEMERMKSEEAKNIVRASRMAVNKLATDVKENLWETKDLKQVISTERGYGIRAAQKYDRLMESSAKKVEELARELDRAHEKARKAR